MRNTLISTLVTLILIASIEIVARVADTIEQDASASKTIATAPWQVYSPILGWERKPGFAGPVGEFGREFDEDGFLTVDTAQVAGTPDRKRVVFIGDSNTFGFGATTADSFVEVAEQLSPDIDAINLGVMGYSSYQGRMAVQKFLPVLKPDLLVVSFNFNDRRYVLNSDSIDGAESFERTYRQSRSATAAIGSILDRSHFYRALKRILNTSDSGHSDSSEAANVRMLRPRVDEASYQKNLSAIAAEAGQMGVPVLFMLLRDNPIQSDHLNKGIAGLEAKDYSTAIAFLNSAVLSNNMFSDLARVYLAQALEATGKMEQAEKALVSPSLHTSLSGGTLIRRDNEYSNIMREVATKYRAPIIDGAAILNAHPEMFIDFCHFNADGHRLLGTQLAKEISAILAEPTAMQLTGSSTLH